MFEENNITALIAITAIISPIIVSLIENLYRSKRYNQEVDSNRDYSETERIKEMVDNYLITIGTIATQITFQYSAHAEYRRKYYVLLPYMSEEIKASMQDIDRLISNQNYKEINNNIENLTNLLSHRKKGE